MKIILITTDIVTLQGMSSHDKVYNLRLAAYALLKRLAPKPQRAKTIIARVEGSGTSTALKT